MLINLKEALNFLNENGVPIQYHTLYTWAVNGVTVGGRPINFATQIGNRWMVREDTMNEIVNGVKNHERVRIQKAEAAPVEHPVATRRTTPAKANKKKSAK
jgi:hypothetical protein